MVVFGQEMRKREKVREHGIGFPGKGKNKKNKILCICEQYKVFVIVSRKMCPVINSQYRKKSY